MKTEASVRSSKGFLFESEDTTRPVLCRDVRGFPAVTEAARDRSKEHPGRLVIVVPDLAMEDWLARWADDSAHPRRTVTITRRTDGTQIRIVGTMLSYGYGVDTTINIERLEQQSRVPRVRPTPAAPATEEAPPKSGVQEAPASAVVARRQTNGVRRRLVANAK